MSETKHITWQPTQYGGWTGHLGNLADWMFQVWKTGAGNWQLDSTLPGQFGCHRYSSDPEELKDVAETWLAEFAAPFANDEEDPAGCPVCGSDDYDTEPGADGLPDYEHGVKKCQECGEEWA